MGRSFIAVIALSAVAMLVLVACATTRPFADDLLHSINTDLPPVQAVQNGTQGTTVFWGGVIVSASNRQNYTDLVVLAYPLDSSQRPQQNKPPVGRFIARYPGYLETVVYVETGTVGKAAYRYPVVKADKMYLWSDKDDSKVHFGIGVGIGVHL